MFHKSISINYDFNMVVNGALVHELYGTAYTFRHFWPMYHFFDHSNPSRLYPDTREQYTGIRISGYPAMHKKIVCIIRNTCMHIILCARSMPHALRGCARSLLALIAEPDTALYLGYQ